MSRLAIAIVLAATALSGIARAQGAATDPIDRMLAALRVEDTVAARIEAEVIDYTESTRATTIEMLRDARHPTMRTVVEVREAGTPAPFLFRLDTLPDGSVVSWQWDIRFGQFVKMAGLEGTESFAGTHFKLEDLGFTGLAARRGGQSRAEGEGPEARLRLTSAPYHHYSRVETWVDPATSLPQRTEIFDGTGARIWELEFDEVSETAGAPLPTRMRATNPVSGETTVLQWTMVAVGVPIPAASFDLEVLAAKMRRGEDPVQLPEPDRASGPEPAGAPETLPAS
jgi:hypothetical protein